MACTPIIGHYFVLWAYSATRVLTNTIKDDRIKLFAYYYATSLLINKLKVFCRKRLITIIRLNSHKQKVKKKNKTISITIDFVIFTLMVILKKNLEIIVTTWKFFIIKTKKTVNKNFKKRNQIHSSGSNYGLIFNTRYYI